MTPNEPSTNGQTIKKVKRIRLSTVGLIRFDGIRSTKVKRVAFLKIFVAFCW